MSTDEIRAVIERCEPRHRLPAAIANVCGITTPDYLPMINLLNDLKRHPDLAGMMAADQAAAYPDGSSQRLADVALILDVLHGLDLGGPEREIQRKALRLYHDVLAEALTGTSEESTP